MQGLTEGLRLADRYVLLRRLGEGGMSDVWAARDERAETVVAIKRIKASLAGHPASRELFHQEWRTGSRLMHAHIVRVFEYHDDADAPFFALQYIDGPEIGVLANGNLDNVLRPFGLIADALRYAHSKAFVHRDIKASNILLDQNGAPYLIDFGVSAASSGGSPVTQSPDRQAGAAAAPADDVYALGVVLHELVYGVPPDGAPISGRRRPDGDAVPTAVERLLVDMLAAEPGARPSAEAVASRLAEAGFPAGVAQLPGGPVSAAADVAPVTVQSRSIKRPGAATATVTPRATSASGGSGVSPSVVYAGLAVLLGLFAIVIFVLPKSVDAPRRADLPDAALEEDSATVADGLPNVDEESAADANAAVPSSAAIPAAGPEGETAGFSENLGGRGSLDVKNAADEALGDLLSQLERLRYRGIDRWGGQPFLDALDVYALGDEAYLARNYAAAGERYREAEALLDPFFGRIDDEFDKALSSADAAFLREDAAEAIRLYDLAVAITPGNARAEKGSRRARNLDTVLDLMNQGQAYRAELALDAARLAFEKALALDPEWQPATEALASVGAEITELSFQMRMTEGLEALAAGDFDSARAAFNAAKSINPASSEPGDGLLQVDQEVRLRRIAGIENTASAQENSEQWEAAVASYEALLEIDGDLAFAKEGLQRSRQRAEIHRRIQSYVDDPDSLSDPATMQQATQMLLNVSRMDPLGPRLTDEKDELSQLLKRAATPLTIRLVSDNETDVSIFRVGKLGRFESRDVELRPGQYVATGSRRGFRDVRLEFRVAPEMEIDAIVIQCEEPI